MNEYNFVDAGRDPERFFAMPGGVNFTSIKPFQCEYKPLPDITAYELALILPLLLSCVIYHGNGFTREEWEKLGTARRHLPEIQG